MESPVSREFSVQDLIRRYGSNQPQRYRIVVVGRLNPEWSGRLAGLSISTSLVGTEPVPVTTLTGPILDQSQLSGVLNTLYELHLTLLGVELLPDAAAHSEGDA